MADSLAQIGGGAVVRVVRADTVVFERAYGAFETDEVVDIASATKWLSGAVIMSLVDSGDLSLDSPLSEFFPGLTGPKRSVTIRQLFSLTSGIVSPIGRDCLGDVTTTLEACAAEVLGRPLRYLPGSGFFYGGGSMQVAARAAEVATGQAWVDLFEERIAEPLGMTDTVYNSETNPRVAGGIRSSASDYTAFLQMVLNGGVHDGTRVLSPSAVDAMLADQTGGVERGAVPVLESPYTKYAGTDPDIPNDALGYGVGVWREQLTESGELRHASSLGAFGFGPWVDVEQDLGGVLLTLDEQPNVFPTYLELKRRIAAALEDAPNPVDVDPTIEATLSLGAPLPNPAANATQIRFETARSGPVSLDLFDVTGRHVTTVLDRALETGLHAVDLDASWLPSGVYVVRLSAGARQASTRLTIAR